MHKSFITGLILLFSLNIYAQQDKDTSNMYGLESVVNLLNSDSPPMIILKIGSSEIQIDKKELYEIELNKIKKISVFERSIQFKEYYAENGALVIYPKREYKKELKKKFIKNGT